MRSTLSEPPVWLIILLVGFPQLSETIFAPILPALALAFEVSKQDAQSTLSFYFLGFAVGVFFWGMLTDAIGRRPCLLIGLLIYSGANFSMLLAGNLEQLLALRILSAFGASTGSVITQTMMRECFAASPRRVAVFASISAALAFSPAIGPLLGGVIVDYLSFEIVFLALALMGSGIFIATIACLKETKSKEVIFANPATLFIRMLTDRKVMAMALLIAFFNAAIFSVYSEGPFLFMGYFHMSPSRYGSVGFMIAFFSVLGAKISKKLAARGWSSVQLIELGVGVCLMASMLQLVVLNLLPATSSWALGWAFLLLGATFIGVVLALPSALSDCLSAYGKNVGQAGAILSLVYYLELSFFLDLAHKAPFAENLKLSSILILCFIGCFAFAKIAYFKGESKNILA